MTEPFADRLTHRLRALGHPLCVGIDPHLERIPSLFRRGAMAAGAEGTAAAVEEFCLALLDRLAGRVAAVKPQSAFFEALGPPGVAALARVAAAARERELLVILDAKRGDIGSTAASYAAAYLPKDAPLRADALTVNAYLGMDSLEPFVAAAAASGAGLFVLVKTSNRGSGDLQDLELEGRPVYAHLAAKLAPLAERLRGPGSAWSSLGAVVGATWPGHARRIRAILPASPFLVPGYGAQGGRPGDALAGLRHGPGGALEGGVVSASRSVIFPPGGETDAAHAWEQAIDAALDAAIDGLLRAAGESRPPRP